MQISKDQLSTSENLVRKAPTEPDNEINAGSGGGAWPEKPPVKTEDKPTEQLKPDTVTLSSESSKLEAGSGGGAWPEKPPVKKP